MKFVCPLVTVSDIERSRSFYEKVLGMKVKYDYGENVTFHGDFAIHLQSHYKSLIENREIKSGGNNFELYFETDDPEALVDNLRNKDIKFIHHLREEPWRQKVARFYDPDQNIIEIGESLENLYSRLKGESLSDSEICTQTGLDEDFIKRMHQRKHR